MSIFKKDSRWVDRAEHQTLVRLTPAVEVIFRAFAQRHANRVLIVATACATDALNVGRCVWRRIAKQNFLQVADVDAHFKGGCGTQQIYTLPAEILLNERGRFLGDLCSVFLTGK